MTEYYAKRASEYELVYEKPERQKDISILKKELSAEFNGLNVLDVACGTGYWTQFIAKSAKSITATDYNQEVIDIAKQKDYGSCHIDFKISDAYALTNIENNFDGSFLGFWWSHIPIQLHKEFLDVFHSHLRQGCKVIILDNIYVENSNIPISRRDEFNNSYQSRKLKDGSSHEVLKNFPTDEEIKIALASYSDDLRIDRLQYFWKAEYKVK
ncbi:MAG: class I SAM-dependent methyltransferase [Fibrobacteres bacterium]|nr:class I SAM-dependent methyltransferase [Fibrobacterota bacterium]